MLTKTIVISVIYISKVSSLRAIRLVVSSSLQAIQVVFLQDLHEPFDHLARVTCFQPRLFTISAGDVTLGTGVTNMPIFWTLKT